MTSKSNCISVALSVFLKLTAWKNKRKQIKYNNKLINKYHSSTLTSSTLLFFSNTFENCKKREETTRRKFISTRTSQPWRVRFIPFFSVCSRNVLKGSKEKWEKQDKSGQRLLTGNRGWPTGTIIFFLPPVPFQRSLSIVKNTR